MDKGKGYWEGKVIKGGGTDFYKVTYCKMPFPACVGMALLYCKSLYDEVCQRYPDLQYTWGYCGPDSEHLAYDILATYAGHSVSWTSNRDAKVPKDPTNQKWTEKDLITYLCPPPRDPPLPGEFIAKHYKQFATDIIANLPDNWKLTFEEIDRWVEQQTKGKNNERESKTTGTETT